MARFAFVILISLTSPLHLLWCTGYFVEQSETYYIDDTWLGPFYLLSTNITIETIYRILPLLLLIKCQGEQLV